MRSTTSTQQQVEQGTSHSEAEIYIMDRLWTSTTDEKFEGARIDSGAAKTSIGKRKA